MPGPALMISQLVLLLAMQANCVWAFAAVGTVPTGGGGSPPAAVGYGSSIRSRASETLVTEFTILLVMLVLIEICTFVSGISCPKGVGATVDVQFKIKSPNNSA